MPELDAFYLSFRQPAIPVMAADDVKLGLPEVMGTHRQDRTVDAHPSMFMTSAASQRLGKILSQKTLFS